MWPNVILLNELMVGHKQQRNIERQHLMNGPKLNK